MAKTKIKWTEKTWNPIRGCSKVSSGCAHCYAERQAIRMKNTYYKGTITNNKWNGKILEVHSHLDDPRKWRKPSMVFVNSMSDLFHESLSPEYRTSVFEVMNETPRHTYQVLTKRAERIVQSNVNWTDNIWMGVSVENEAAMHRIDDLRKCGAKVKFLSLEPLIGELPNLDLTGIHWVIVGGESGPGWRPMNEKWVRDIRDKCIADLVPFFFKQWAGLHPSTLTRLVDGADWSEFPAKRETCSRCHLDCEGEDGEVEYYNDNGCQTVDDGPIFCCACYLAVTTEQANTSEAMRSSSRSTTYHCHRCQEPTVNFQNVRFDEKCTKYLYCDKCIDIQHEEMLKRMTAL